MRALLALLALLGGTEAAQAQERIVAVGGAVTEIVYALGQAHRLVAVDSTSQHPPEADALPDVGYQRRLSAEPILSLQPDLVLAIEDAGPPAVLDQLRAAGVRVVPVPNAPTIEGIGAKIRAVGLALGVADAGEALAREVEAELAAGRERTAGLSRQPSVLFLMSAGKGAPMAAGTGTAADAMIALAGGRNATAGVDGYKPLSPEAAVAAAPEVVLVMRQTLESLGGPDGVLAIPGLAATPAGAARRVVAMDGMLLLGLGPRTPQAVAELTAALHPGPGSGG